jgi:hypothetical protein
MCLIHSRSLCYNDITAKLTRERDGRAISRNKITNTDALHRTQALNYFVSSYGFIILLPQPNNLITLFIHLETYEMFAIARPVQRMQCFPNLCSLVSGGETGIQLVTQMKTNLLP